MDYDNILEEYTIREVLDALLEKVHKMALDAGSTKARERELHQGPMEDIHLEITHRPFNMETLTEAGWIVNYRHNEFSFIV